MIYAIDANILVYASNPGQRETFLKANRFLNEQVLTGKIEACIAYQTFYEFYAIVTDGRRVERPLNPLQAREIIDTYRRARNIRKIHALKSNLQNTLHLLTRYPISRQEIFDAVLVATLMDNGIGGIITADEEGFSRFEFLQVVNPLR